MELFGEAMHPKGMHRSLKSSFHVPPVAPAARLTSIEGNGLFAAFSDWTAILKQTEVA
ncbi:MAG: hypothetical protein ACTTH3_07080 [Schwartzia sp. (in: firmicutes)]